MTTTRPQKTLEAFIVGGFLATSFNICLTFNPSPWNWVLGVPVWCLGESIRHRHKLTYPEVVSGSFAYSGQILDDISRSQLGGEAEKAKVQIVTNVLKQVPFSQRWAASLLAKSGVTEDWFEGFEKRTAIVCGESGDGKTHLLLWRVQRFLEAHPDGILTICDMDYGSSHEGSKPNDWFGLPLDSAILTESEQMYQAIISTSAEVDRRSKLTIQAVAEKQPKPKFAPLLLIFDEWVSFYDGLKKEEKESIITAIKNIINRGIKQGDVLMLIGLHDLSVGSTGFSQAILGGIEAVLLRRASQLDRNYKNLGTESQEVSDVISKIKLLPSEIRPCILWSGKKLSVRAVPDLQIEGCELVKPEDADTDQNWVNGIFSPEFELVILRENLTLSQAWERGGQQRKQQRADNPRYVIFRERFELSKNQNPNPETPKNGRWTVEETEETLKVLD